MNRDDLAAAFASTRTVLANVKPGQLDDTTPCASWTVRQLINHFVGGPRIMARLIGTGEWAPRDEDFCAGDVVAAYDETARQALAAFAGEGVLVRTFTLPFAELPGSFLMAMVITDQVGHGWDLARATGQSSDLVPDLAAELLAAAAVPDEFRGPDGSPAPFGPVQQAPEGATAADRLAAYLGRSV